MSATTNDASTVADTVAVANNYDQLRALLADINAELARRRAAGESTDTESDDETDYSDMPELVAVDESVDIAPDDEQSSRIFEPVSSANLAINADEQV